MGAEKVARETRGMNQMSPRASARLMAAIVDGRLEPQARDYMMELLDHDIRKGNSVLGWGLPLGSLYYNKPGLAYDTLEDIACCVLPNGREFFVAAFSNAFVPPYSKDPSPHDGSQLAGFMELLLKKTGLDKGCPPSVVVDDADPGCAVPKGWDADTSGTDHFGPRFVRTRGGQGKNPLVWNLRVPEDGRYEVSVFGPQGPGYEGDALFTVEHANGRDVTPADQRKVGGRWRRLGDFRFRRGEGRVLLSDRVTGPGRFVVGDAVRAVRWPDGETAPPRAVAAGDRQTTAP
jgi:hypothetical protein